MGSSPFESPAAGMDLLSFKYLFRVNLTLPVIDIKCLREIIEIVSY